VRAFPIVLVLAACGGAAPAVHDTYHGVTVADPYRWLEADDARAHEWAADQDRRARAVLDHLPDLPAVHAELAAILRAPITTYGHWRTAGGRLFATRVVPDKEQPELIVLDDPDHPERARLVIDPTARGGAHVTIDWYVPSPDGTRVAVSLSEGGSESGTLHVLDLDGKDVDRPIPGVQRGTGGGDAAWAPDGKGLYYTRYPAPGEKPEPERAFWLQVWFHELGSDRDRYEMGKDLPKIAEILLESDARGRVIASVQNGDGGVFRHYLRDGDGSWRQLDDWQDEVAWVGFGPGADLWLISRKDAPRGKILRLPATARSVAEAQVVVPEGKDAIFTDYPDEWGLVASGDRLYATFQTGGPSELRVFDLAGQPQPAPQLPPIAKVVAAPTPWQGGVLVGATSFTVPLTWFYAPAGGTSRELAALSQKPPVDYSSFEVHREFATSTGGTQVPLNIMWPKGAPRDGSVRCLVTGYGGFDISMAPAMPITAAPLLSRGYCFVLVNLRGGGEYGEAWHRDGMLTRKQHVFDDFAAALQFLIAGKYTSADHLAILGGSNGGLLMGALLTQRPELVKAVVAMVGIFDILRNELTSNGSYNVPEYGSVNDAEQFAAMYAYSPYHHVRAGVRYPAVLMTTGANDARVAPWHSRKMTAALQAAAPGVPILLRISQTSGHGAGTDTTELIDRYAAVDAFILWQLGVRG
jgi:prolyl oligopeptidase